MCLLLNGDLWFIGAAQFPMPFRVVSISFISRKRLDE